MTYVTDGFGLEERKLTSQSPSITVEFSVQYNLNLSYYLVTRFGVNAASIMKIRLLFCQFISFSSNRETVK